MTDDIELLRRYAEHGSEEAFTELVRRHVDFVYAAALRQTHGTHRAEEVAQAVFADLARKARRLSGRTELVSWLHVSTHYAATAVVRSEARRAARERKAQMSQDSVADPSASADWESLRAILDDALQGLGEIDRAAILLRYFKNRSFAEIGAVLSLTEEAARKRVDRALEKLRPVLARRGLVSTTAALAMALASEASVAAPAGLIATISSSALAGAAAASGATAAMNFLHLMSTTKTVSGIASLVALLAIISAGYQFKVARDSNARLASVSRERDALQARLATTKERGQFPGDQTVAGPKHSAFPQPKESSWNSISPAAYVFDHPEARAAFVRREVQEAKAKFDRFFRSSGLSAEEQDKFLTQLTGWAQAKLDLAADLATQGYGPENPPQDPEAYMKLFEVDNQVDTEYLNNLHTLLGDSLFQQFTDYGRTIPEFNVATQLAGQLYDTDDTLTTQQASQLVQVLKANPYNEGSAPSAFNTLDGTSISSQAIGGAKLQANLVNGENMMPSLEWTAPVTDAAFIAAQAFLTPTQLAALRQVQAQQAAQYQLAPPPPPQPDINALVRARKGGN